MADKWVEVSLREAGVQLLDCEHRTPPAADTGFPYVAIPQLKNGRIELADVRRISHEHFVDWTRKTKPQAWDVILSRRCNPGETAFVPADLECALGQNLVVLRSNGKRIYAPFLRWLLRGPAWWDQVRTFINVGAVFESLKCADIPNFRLSIPSMVEQQAIACILGALDGKIELNRRMNRTLEGLARALFQSWFVDFDPVRAKAAGQTPPGLAPHVAKLFPNAFEGSELSDIPQGWRVRSMEHEATVTKGVSYKGQHLCEASEGLPMHNLNSVYEGGGYKHEGLKWYKGEFRPRHLLEPGDVIVTNTEQGFEHLLIGYAAPGAATIWAKRAIQPPYLSLASEADQLLAALVLLPITTHASIS